MKLSFLLLILIFPQLSHAKDFHLKLTVDLNPKATGIEWDQSEDTQEPKLKTHENSKEPSYFVSLKGRLKKVGEENLLYHDKIVPLGSAGEFSIDVEIHSEQTSFSLMVIDNYGDVKVIDGNLLFSEWATLNPSPIKDEPLTETKNKPNRFSLFPALQLNYFGYQEPANSTVLNELGLLAKVDLRYSLFPEKLDLGASTFFTLVPIWKNPYSLADVRLFGIDLQGRYWLPWPLLGLKWQVLVGFNLWSMIVSDSSFGVTYVGGPEVGISLTRELLSKQSYFGYLKLVLFGNSETSLSLKNPAFALGGGYPIAKWREKEIHLIFDLAQTSVTFDDLRNRFSLFTVSLGTQVTF